MFLKMDNLELLHLLENYNAISQKVNVAIAILHVCSLKQEGKGN